ncbi:MAG: hypothetical protein QW228_04200 [Candidatus Aenigmatarchaeota archaeon]
MIDLHLIASFMFYSSLGAITRALFGIYKAYVSVIDFRIDWRRVLIEIIASIFFGTFGALILKEVGVFNFSMVITALIAGFFGADIVSLITKKFGLTKSLEVKVVEQQVALSEFNQRQIAALEYLKNHKKITNSIYQKLNQVDINTAKRDLAQLVKKGKLKRFGKGKSTYYTLAGSG